LNIIAGGQTSQNFEGDRVDAQLHTYIGGQTLQFWNWSTFFIYRPNVMDDALLRGGPVVQKPGQTFVEANVNTDSRHTVIWGGDASYATNRLGGWGSSLAMSVEIRPTSSVNITLGPSWNDSRSL